MLKLKKKLTHYYQDFFNKSLTPHIRVPWNLNRPENGFFSLVSEQIKTKDFKDERMVNGYETSIPGIDLKKKVLYD